jgi:MoaA/NifB/PqqE/SkfB family radical SAM enzyme
MPNAQLLMLKRVVDNLDPKLSRAFIPWAARHPRYLRSFIRLASSHKQTVQARLAAKSQGLQVPPFLILSITSRCNLHCEGCYAAAVSAITTEESKSSQQPKSHLSWEKWRSIIAEASELGVFGFVIAGGEPFLFSGLLDLCEEFKDRFFLIVTNGTALLEEDFDRLKRASNLIVIVSIEGDQKATDARRGAGVYKTATETLNRLNEMGVLTGISVTINTSNYEYWLDEKALDDLISQGIRLSVFIEYIPLTPADGQLHQSTTIGSDHDLILNAEERARFRSKILNYRRAKPIYIIHSPGDEEFFGGCVSAGRGFAHITPAGDLTPCPVSDIATHNLKTVSLREGLASPLFREICKSEHLLETEGMPCALFAHPQEVREIGKAVGAYVSSTNERF